MFEDTPSYDCSDDILCTSFATSKTSQQNYLKHSGNICKQVEKKHSLDTSSYDENTKKSKLNKYDIFKMSVINAEKNSPRKAVQRKFPGPAGLLPDNINNSVTDICQNPISQSSTSAEVFLCSQQNLSVFETGPWQQMIHDFQDSNRELLFEKFNIFWIKQNFSGKKQQTNYKAPFLACRIESIECTDGEIPRVKIMLKDKTGLIPGAIVHSLYKEYSDYFIVGSVLVLIQFGVLSAKNSHTITITPNSLLTIYSMDIKSTEDKCETTKPRTKKIALQHCSIDDIWKNHSESLNSYEGKKYNLLKNETCRQDSKNLNNSYNPNIRLSIAKCDNWHNSFINDICSENLQTENVRGTQVSSPQNLKERGSKAVDKASIQSDSWKELFQEVDLNEFLSDF